MAEEKRGDGQKMVTLPLELPVDLHGKLKAIAFLRGVSMKEIICDWIEQAEDPGIRAGARVTRPPKG